MDVRVPGSGLDRFLSGLDPSNPKHSDPTGTCNFLFGFRSVLLRSGRFESIIKVPIKYL